MVRDSQISTALNAFARTVCEHVGRGKPLGALEVADATGVSDEQVRRLCSGTATPDFDWGARFTAAFADRFPEVVDGAWNAYFAVFGRRLSRIDAGGPAFLDANGDGRRDTTDAVLHASEIGRLESQYQQGLLKGNVPAAEMDANRFQMQRHIDALAELARTPAYPRPAAG